MSAKQVSDALGFALMEHLGPAALTGGTMSIHDAFVLGWNAALDADVVQPVEPVDNPWRESIENILKGDNYFRAGEWYELLADLDRLYAAPQSAAINAELLAACAAIVAWDDAEKDAPTYASDNGAHWRMRQALCVDAFDKARAAIARATGEAA